jgi:hypothetical protein
MGGVLFGASKRIDGIEIIKYGRKHPFDFKHEIIGHALPPFSLLEMKRKP